MRKLRALAVGVVTLACLGVVTPGWLAWSQANRVIRVIITVPPGGSIDLLFRILTDKIAATKGQTFIIESRPGAGGVIAAEAVARSTPDGTTLLSNNNGTIISALLRKVNYDPLTSFAPVCNLVSTPQILAVNAASPYRTLADLLDAARTKPGELSIASVGPNTTQHLGIERLKRLAGVNMTYVPYAGGAPTVNAILGAHVTSAVVNWSEVGEQVRAGKVRAIATLSLKRIEPLPDLPTVSESGFKDFETDVWFGVAAPAKTPPEMVTQLVDWFRAALQAPDARSKLVAQALYPNAICGADFDAQLRRYSAFFAQLIREANLKTE